MAVHATFQLIPLIRLAPVDVGQRPICTHSWSITRPTVGQACLFRAHVPTLLRAPLDDGLDEEQGDVLFC